ncbi:hypothetical protein [Metapseudomonas otitidis]|uniref:hypothetical protein n=1 Tax=Metapseudomonas otitidis TaxID=319939 RepID=UPI0013F62164|nr:hypothetical protein [Pseudomonas otitidis]
MGGDNKSREDRGEASLREIRRALGRDDQDLQRERDRVNLILANLADNEDARINFRTNSLIKEEFERLCRSRGSTLSRELRRFMAQAISRQRFFDQ